MQIPSKHRQKRREHIPAHAEIEKKAVVSLAFTLKLHNLPVDSVLTKGDTGKQSIVPGMALSRQKSRKRCRSSSFTGSVSSLTATIECAKRSFLRAAGSSLSGRGFK